MDPKLAFWALALVNMAAIVVLALRGVRAIRRGDVASHQSQMKTAGALIVAFLVAYLVKVPTLGSEDLSTWSQAARINLWIHEGFVAAMLVAGIIALVFARRFAASRRVTGAADDPPADPADLRKHRLVGRIAVVGAGFGFLTACGILAGMVSRAG